MEGARGREGRKKKKVFSYPMHMEVREHAQKQNGMAG